MPHAGSRLPGRALQSTVAAAEPAPAPSADDNAVRKLGLELAAASGGAKVVSVEPDSPAAQRGIEQGDVIVAAGGKDVAQPADVAAALAEGATSSSAAKARAIWPWAAAP